MREGSLERLLRGDESATLDWAALELARIEFPNLDPEPWVDCLDTLAEAVAARMEEGHPGAFLRAATDYLFLEYGLRGNEASYYDPHNSCLNEVLRRKTGIPISLAVVFLEVGRRLGEEVYGIPLPGHFVAQWSSGPGSAYIDVYHAGLVMNRFQVEQFIRDRGGNVREQDFVPATGQQIAMRMLNNLRGVYGRGRAYTKAIAVIDWMLVARPQAPELWRQRGHYELERGAFAQARRDLEQYLHLAPEADDRVAVERQIASLDVGPVWAN